MPHFNTLSSHYSSEILHDDDYTRWEGENSSFEVARLSVHESNEADFHWPLIFTVCTPDRENATVMHPEYYAYPVVCAIEKATVYYKNMMHGKVDLPKYIVAMDGTSILIPVNQTIFK